MQRLQRPAAPHTVGQGSGARVPDAVIAVRGSDAADPVTDDEEGTRKGAGGDETGAATIR